MECKISVLDSFLVVGGHFGVLGDPFGTPGGHFGDPELPKGPQRGPDRKKVVKTWFVGPPRDSPRATKSVQNRVKTEVDSRFGFSVPFGWQKGP